ncbi:MAG: hypothetical protein C0485_19535 [Pirellula sp.]|nr:hypothetical protein [Pirellula sp.]
MSTRLVSKVLLIVWDAADWALCQPLLDGGLMPHLQRLIERGASGPIASVIPWLSPPAWTSIATGKRPHKHGIHGMAEPDPEAGGVRSASSQSRTTKAIWNIVTQRGLAANVVGWRGSHPAEPISGLNVTDRHALANVAYGKPWPQPAGSAYPPELRADFEPLRVHPEQLDRESLAFFLPELEQIKLRDMHRVTACATWLAATVTNHAVATWAMEHRTWDLMAVGYSGIEQFSHAFLHARAPHEASASAEEGSPYQQAIPACYRFHDRMLGRLLELAGDETAVILTSDHGIKSGAMLPAPVRHAPEDVETRHRRFGIFVAAGPHIRPGVRIKSASILDVTPTILTMFGLPVGKDMDGKPLNELFDVDVAPDWLPSWDEEPGEAGTHSIDESDRDQELRQMLEQLQQAGFRDPDEQSRNAKEQEVIARNQFNCARSLIEGGQHREAQEILEKLASNSPSPKALAGMLIESYLVCGQLADAQRVVDLLLPKESDQPLADLTLGRIELQSRRPEAALACLRRAAAADAGNPRIYVFLGEAWLALRQWTEAGLAFQQAIELDPSHAEAHCGRAVVSLRGRNFSEAAESAQAAIDSYQAMPSAHYYLGVALASLGDYAQAALSLERAVGLAPEYRTARRRLARLYEVTLDEPTRAAEHRRQLKGLRQSRFNP